MFNKGGLVRGSAGEDRVVTIAGNATFEWDGEVEVDLATGVVTDLTIVKRRAEEVASWEAALR